MKIALIGYGKMGKAIEEQALQRGHEVPLKIDLNNRADLTAENLRTCDVAIEFTGPETALENILFCQQAGVPVVCGSTGWLARWDEAVGIVHQKGGGFLYASNFSVGVNIFFEVNKLLANLMDRHKEYDVSVEEIHHTEKKDAPSGTGITLAEQILQMLGRKKSWVNHEEVHGDQLAIISKRIDPAPGTHIVTYHSEIDDIEIKHVAHSRKGFALGAVQAAEYLKGRQGVFSMKDVLGI